MFFRIFTEFFYISGNEVNKLLKNLDALADILPPELNAFYDCLKTFQAAMDGTFGFTLDPFYEKMYEEFSVTYMTLSKQFGFSITPKVHIMIRHVPEYIKRTGMPIGYFSEQVVEAAHSDFDRFFNAYRVKDINSPAYSSRFLRAILHYNGYHT